MPNLRVRRIWRRFCLRHGPVWRYIDSNDESYWVDLGDVAGQFCEAMWTTEGAVVREFPQVRDAGTQTEATANSDVAVQAGDPGATSGEVPSQANAPPNPTVNRSTWPRTRPDLRSWLRGDGCWNCWSDEHPYTRCPLPRIHSFCYGCGLRDATLRTCPRCGPVYVRTEPYTAPRGPRDPQRLRREQRESFRRAREPDPEWGWKSPTPRSTSEGRDRAD